MKVTLKHTESGLIKEVPIGYSWTTFLIGAVTPLSRGDLKWGSVFILCGIIIALLFGNWTPCIFYFVMGFFYNNLYIRDLLEKGYKPLQDTDRGLLIKSKILPDTARPSLEHVYEHLEEPDRK